MSDRCIAVTGASGFVGRHTADALLARGLKVRALVRDYATLPGRWLRDQRFEAVPLDTSPLRGCDALVHLAGLAAEPRENGVTRLQAVNVELTGRLVEAAKDASVGTLIFMSSIRAVAGPSADVVLDDSTIAEPVDAYGRSKRMAEKIATSFASDQRVAIALRPPLVIGGDAGGNWARLQRLADTRLWLPFGSIANRRSYVSVQTLSAAIAHLAAQDWPVAKSDIYAIADPQRLSLTEVMDQLRYGMNRRRRLLNVPAPALRPSRLLPGFEGSAASLFGDLVVDGRRFEDSFGFRPSLALSDAVRRSGMEYSARHG